MDERELLEFLKTHVEYRDGSLYVKVAWSKKGNVGRNISVLKKNYYFTSIMGKWYRSHRLIYLMFHGELPEVVDHKDRNKLNNLVENLRGCSKEENERNRTAYKNNTSGYKGVWFHKPRNKWCAEITVNGKSIKLGLHTTPEGAAEAYNKASEEYHGEFGFKNVIKKGIENGN